MEIESSSRGRVEENNSKPAAQLMETTVIVKDQQECTEKTKELAFFNPESMICAHRKLTDACQVRVLSVKGIF